MNLQNKKVNLALVGATGLVGIEFIKILNERDFPFNKLFLFASEKNFGKKIKVKDKLYTVNRFDEKYFDDIDIAFFATSTKDSLKMIKMIKNKKTVSIDNSSAFRMKENVPLVVPEVNFNKIKKRNKIIANPNCSTIQLVTVLNLLRQVDKINSVVVSTYQAISGGGKELMNIFLKQQKGIYSENEPAVFNNLIQFIGKFKNGFCEEEYKIINETKKILENKKLRITATTIRVPVLNSHTQSVMVEFKKNVGIDKIKKIINNSPSIVLTDITDPISVSGTNLIFVSRLRKDPFFKNRIHFIITADNLRIGAALNGIKIAERLIDEI